MNIVPKIMIGLVIFNAMIYATSGIFSYSTHSDATDITEEQGIGQYGNIDSLGDMLLSQLLNPITLAIIGILITASLGIGFVTGGGAKFVPVAIGIGIFISLIIALWNATSKIIFSITPDSLFVNAILDVSIIIIGIIIIFYMVSFFTGQQVVDQ